MNTVEQIAAVVPFGESVLHQAEKAYDFSKEKTIVAYKTTKGKIVQTRKDYIDFRKNVQKTVYGIAEQTVNEVLSRFEGFLKIEKSEGSSEDLKHARQRLQSIVVALYKDYVLKSRLVDNRVSQSLIKAGKKYTVSYVIPMYINIRATLIVSKQMLIEFVENCLNDIKLTYESSKDNVTMFVAGNFNEEGIKKKISEGIDTFKNMTVKVVNRGLEIKIDRQSLVENYDQFAVKLLEIVKEMRSKGEENITQIKKKSRDLYKQVVSRIRAKELQLRTNLKDTCSSLEAQEKQEKTQ